ncbi:type II toxin-antitoxin system VapC family toxin [Sphingomonas sp. Leaf37]|uniref:type II toxin-antitoxin system VapC family toxin n=1 Tax=Sphingomonas sp. Leaf37 TaxID=2876552 RepID=UPI001E381630|nr:type II toxin-antitoxin system VapC family toxin [Sphingomonas sp. Leaf37]
MTIFVDASAIVAIVYGEPEADAFADAIERHNDRCYCAIGAWEATRAIAKLRGIGLMEAYATVTNFVQEAGLRLAAIGAPESEEAIMAAARYGKGVHPAGLNMGDCFAYACAKASDAHLLYKGDDFSQTDLA